jgi:hypothetical protein
MRSNRRNASTSTKSATNKMQPKLRTMRFACHVEGYSPQKVYQNELGASPDGHEEIYYKIRVVKQYLSTMLVPRLAGRGICSTKGRWRR